MKCVDKDSVMLALKDRLIRAQNKGDRRDIELTNAVMTIMRLMPEIDVQDSVNCSRYWFYAAKKKHCIHNNGLQGRVLPQMYCCYASPVKTDTETEIDETAFAEFDEEGGKEDE